MKHFIVISRDMQEMYSDIDSGEVDSLTANAVFLFYEESTGEEVASIRFGKVVLAVKKIDPLRLIAFSDEGDDENDLFSQLQLVYDLLTMFFGTITKFSPTISEIKRSKAKAMRLIDTMQTLRNTNRSVLVNAIEFMDINESIKAEFLRDLNQTVMSVPGVTFAMVLVGNKILVKTARKRHEKRPSFSSSEDKTETISNYDLFMLILHAQSVHRGTVRNGASVCKQSEATCADGNGGQCDDAGSDGGDSSDADESEVVGQATVLSLDHGRVKRLVYTAEFLHDHFIVVVSDTKESSSVPALDEVARKEKNYYENFCDFLRTKVYSLSPLPFITAAPGLITFIYVNRTTHQCFMPSIIPLYGKAAAPNHTEECLSHLIHEMVSHGRKALARGETLALTRKGEFHFAYHLWFTVGGCALPQQVVTDVQRLPWTITPQLYDDLTAVVRRENGAKHLLCHELFSVYCGTVPATAIAEYDPAVLERIASDA